MDVTVKELVYANNNPLIVWEIDGHIFNGKERIPERLLETKVCGWLANWYDGIIEVSIKETF